MRYRKLTLEPCREYLVYSYPHYPFTIDNTIYSLNEDQINNHSQKIKLISILKNLGDER